MRLSPSNRAYFFSSSVTTRKRWALWSKPPAPCIAASSARSPAWPNGGWPRSWASASASARSSSSAKRAGERAGDLRHFEAVGQPRAVMIALVIDEDLGLVVQPAEGGRMQDAVAVARVRRARVGTRRLGDEAAHGSAQRIDGVGRKRDRRQWRRFRRLRSSDNSPPVLLLWSIDNAAPPPYVPGRDWLHPR